MSHSSEVPMIRARVLIPDIQVAPECWMGCNPVAASEQVVQQGVAEYAVGRVTGEVEDLSHHVRVQALVRCDGKPEVASGAPAICAARGLCHLLGAAGDC